MNTDLVAQKALDHLAKDGVESLTETEKTLAAAWLFDAGVSNGGFLRYFSGSRGDLAGHAPGALRAIGAMRLADIAAEANAVFGAGGPPGDRAERRRRVKALSSTARLALTALEERFDRCDENIDELLERYLAHLPS